MLKNIFKIKKDSDGIKGVRSLNRAFNSKPPIIHMPRKRWVWQLIISCFMLVFILGSIYLGLPGSIVMKEYIAYYLHAEKSDWTPAIKTMVNNGLWLDSYDRQVYEKQMGKKPAFKDQSETMALPASGKFLREYGWIESPVDKNKKFHSGIDIETEIGAPVRATLAGVVVKTWVDEDLGRSIEIRHNDELTTIYGNCGEVLVNEGQDVGGGQIIAKAGKGMNGGKLHFEVRRNGKPIDPLTVLSPLQSRI